MAQDKEVLLKVEHLCQYFKMGKKELKAVHDISFDIYKGEVFGLVGESGCGKTTTGRTIIKLYEPTSGNVYFKGQRICAGIRSYKDAIKTANQELNVAKKTGDKAEINAKKKARDAILAENSKLIKEARFDQKNCDKVYAKQQVAKIDEAYAQALEKAATEEQKIKLEAEYNKNRDIAKHQRLVTEIQMIFQDPIASLDPRMTVREIVSEGLIIDKIKDKQVIDEKVYEVLERVGLVREHASRYPHEFSGGQRQRIGVARSIIMQPSMIIADEPVSALDVSIQAQVINLLNELRHEMGLTIMFIAHDLSVVKYFSDRIGVMYYGDLVEMTTSDKLFAHPLHPYTKSLLSAIPLPDPIYEKKRKRIVYNPLVDHDYSADKPILREVEEGHFVMCNNEEFERYCKLV